MLLINNTETGVIDTKRVQRRYSTSARTVRIPTPEDACQLAHGNDQETAQGLSNEAQLSAEEEDVNCEPINFKDLSPPEARPYVTQRRGGKCTE